MPLSVGYPSVYLAVVSLPLGESATAVIVLDGLLSGLLVGMGLRDFFSSVTSLDDGLLAEGDPPEADDVDESDYFGDDDYADDFGDELDLDEFEAEEDGWDEEFGGSSTEVVELEQRLDEMEDELESTTSTINAVRSENEELAGSIEEIRDNVRKLLEIYELVTRGVNPFADDAGAGTAPSRSASGLFEKRRRDADDRGTGDFETFDPASFFADDADGEAAGDREPIEGTLEAIEPDGEPIEADDGSAEVDEADEPTAPKDADDASSAPGAKTFEDLKSEYEAGRSAWTGFVAGHEDDRPDDRTRPAESTTEDAPATSDERSTAGRETGEAAAPTTAESPEPPLDMTQPRSDPATARTAAESEPDAGTDEAEERPPDEPATAATRDTYLERLPDGVASDVVAVEWMEFLIGRTGLAGAMRAVDYYVDVGWIGDPLKEDLKSLLVGLDDRPSMAGRSDGSLRVEDHLRSLAFVQRLCGDHPSVAEVTRSRRDFPVGIEAEIAERPTDRSRGEPYGIQR